MKTCFNASFDRKENEIDMVFVLEKWPLKTEKIKTIAKLL